MSTAIRGRPSSCSCPDPTRGRAAAVVDVFEPESLLRQPANAVHTNDSTRPRGRSLILEINSAGANPVLSMLQIRSLRYGGA